MLARRQLCLPPMPAPPVPPNLARLVLLAIAAEGMLTLARQGVVHVVSSDAHSSHGGRPVRLSGALARLAEVEPVASHLDWVAREAPRAIVAGEDLVAPFAPEPA